jgi:hypothetical protein
MLALSNDNESFESPRGSSGCANRTTPRIFLEQNLYVSTTIQRTTMIAQQSGEKSSGVGSASVGLDHCMTMSLTRSRLDEICL